MGKRMRKHGKRNAVLSILLLILFAAGLGGQTGKSDQPELDKAEDSVIFEVSSGDQAEKSAVSKAEGQDQEEAALQEQTKDSEKAAPDMTIQTLSVGEIPAYSGEAAIEVNQNVPGFTKEDYTTEAFEQYSPLDELGRCHAAYACVGEEIMPTEERGAIGMVKPSGWHTVKYDFVDGKYLYNRCHLIAYMLSGENANTENLITGTRYLNTEGMLPYENQVADYVHNTGNHVLYRVTPLYEGDNLVASGVEIEASSVEDRGKSLSFHVYCYNVQPGITIDYATGDSALAEDDQTENVRGIASELEVFAADALEETKAAAGDQSLENVVTAAVQEETSAEQDGGNAKEERDYVLNKNTKKFHYPWCSSADDIKKKNRKDFTGTREEVISQGYVPCKRCNP